MRALYADPVDPESEASVDDRQTKIVGVSRWVVRPLLRRRRVRKSTGEVTTSIH